MKTKVRGTSTPNGYDIRNVQSVGSHIDNEVNTIMNCTRNGGDKFLRWGIGFWGIHVWGYDKDT